MEPDTHIDYSQKWFILAAVAVGIFLATIDGSIVNIALPTLVREFNQELAVVEWVVLVYLLTISTLILGVGRLADIIGKKVLYLVGIVVFTLSSMLCGLSQDVYILIMFRVVQAVGATLMMALGAAIVTEAFPTNERGKALGINGLMVSLGVIIGPTIGGIILEGLSWHWLFFVNLPVGIVGIFMVARYVPQVKSGRKQQFDIWGALVLCAALISFLFALTTGQRGGFSQPVVWILGLISLVALVVFIQVELRARDPMIDLRIFRNGLFSINLVTGFLSFMASAGTTLLMPFYLQTIMNYSPRTAGLMLSVVPLAIGIVAPFSGAVSDRIGTRPLTALGLFIAFLGYVAVSTIDQTTTQLGYILRFIPIGVGIGLFQSPNNSAIMGSAPKERLGVISGLLSITRTLGQITGIATLGAIWDSRVQYHQSAGVSNTPELAGLGDALMVSVALFFSAACLAIWALFKESSSRRKLQSQAADVGRQVQSIKD